MRTHRLALYGFCRHFCRRFRARRFSMGALCDLPAVELRALLGRRAISPVELMDACLARIEAANPTLNAIVVERYAAARAEAAAAEARLRQGEPLRPLFGLPLGVKDL